MTGPGEAFKTRATRTEEERKAVLPSQIYRVDEVALYSFTETFSALCKTLYAPLGEFYKNSVAASKGIEKASNKDRLYSESNPSPAPFRVAESNPSPAPARLAESNPSPAPLLYALEFLGITPVKIAESKQSIVPFKKV
ncbi:TPA: hypothetical protein HA238_03080 [Candidatus Micrarchaeota archaeon]|nr:hypothetical protein [Candidatus Micrarchaeota archaeon]